MLCIASAVRLGYEHISSILFAKNNSNYVSRTDTEIVPTVINQVKEIQIVRIDSYVKTYIRELCSKFAQQLANSYLASVQFQCPAKANEPDKYTMRV